MPRKRKSETPVQETGTTTSTMTLEPQPDTSVEPQPATPVEPEPVVAVEPTPSEQSPSFVDRLGERSSRKLVPDPFLIALDNAAGVRLFENRQSRVMAIAFDEKPSQPIIDMVKEAGFRWNAADSVWTHPVRADSAMGTRIDAEHLYQEVRQMIRQDKGTDAGQDIPF